MRLAGMSRGANSTADAQGARLGLWYPPGTHVQKAPRCPHADARGHQAQSKGQRDPQGTSVPDRRPELCPGTSVALAVCTGFGRPASSAPERRVNTPPRQVKVHGAQTHLRVPKPKGPHSF